MKDLQNVLQSAIDQRQRLALFRDTECVRIFYGPGESTHASLRHFAVDLFGDQLWVTQWKKPADAFVKQLKVALGALTWPEGVKVRGAVLMDRSEVASDENSVPLLGNPSSVRFTATEFGARYSIQMLNTKHPGLFLDHAPLRAWLQGNQSGRRVLNLFSYTGSLSIAAARGGAAKVTTLDLSKATIEWAQENWKLNELAEERGDFVYGDVFEWLPKFARRGDQYDTILSDPPSFSRSKNGTFSTQKDLARLHTLIFSVLAPGGTLVTSINSENIGETAFLRDIDAAAKKSGIRYQILRRVDLPETFPTSDASLKDRYLKGFYLLRV